MNRQENDLRADLCSQKGAAVATQFISRSFDNGKPIACVTLGRKLRLNNMYFRMRKRSAPTSAAKHSKTCTGKAIRKRSAKVGNQRFTVSWYPSHLMVYPPIIGIFATMKLRLVVFAAFVTSVFD